MAEMIHKSKVISDFNLFMLKFLFSILFIYMFGFICSLRMMGKVKLKDKVGKLGEGRRRV